MLLVLETLNEEKAIRKEYITALELDALIKSRKLDSRIRVAIKAEAPVEKLT